MPDRDGIETFARGDFGCAYCQASRLSYVQAEEHRRRCGPKWRRTYGQRRREANRDEQVAMAAIAVEDS